MKRLGPHAHFGFRSTHRARATVVPCVALATLALVGVGWIAKAVEPKPSSAEPASDQERESGGAGMPRANGIDFAKHIQPIFVEHCGDCHGSEFQEAGLRLDHRQSALRGGDSGPAWVAHKPDESLLLERITAEDEYERMPPPYEDEIKPLSDEQIALLRRWIEQGAPWPKDVANEKHIDSDHWAYQPIERPELPKVENESWVRNPIDHFVLARLEEQGISPSPTADRPTLIKRLYYDLLGLPPKPEEVGAFVADESPHAYEKLVDRILASPHFGERWGRHWLDMARYADSDGYEKDRPRPNAWRYRDWVIRGINEDMPFDQFTIEQLAGDLLPEVTPEQKLATAFHRQTLTNTEGGTDKEEFRVVAVKDRVDTTGTVWLGLTVGCAQCHSHKYDRITQREYYEMFAFFNNGDETQTEVPVSDEAVAGYEKDKAAYARQLAETKQQIADHRVKLAAELPQIEKRLKAESVANPNAAVEFHALEAAQIASEGKAILKRLDDGSYLASGAEPASDTYTLIAKVELPEISGVRLDVLPDESLPSKGPGRTAHGNFVLSELEVHVSANEAFSQARRVALVAAEADHSQSGWPAQAAIDGKSDTGWAIAPQFGKEHQAVFKAAKPITLEAASWVKIVLRQQYGSRHTIGRFRIALRTGHAPGDGVPQAVRGILATAPDKRSDPQKAALLDFAMAEDSLGAKLVARLDRLEKNPPKRPVMDVRVIAQRTGNPRTTHIMRRGDFLQPQDEVQPATLEVLHPLNPRSSEQPADRLDLARWLVDETNPLTPRVTVNHVWMRLFGEGLVRTANDFGVRGDPPTHPRLLDWLATEFTRLDWSRKALIRRIVSSATYRQSSHHRPELADADPTNRLLYRQNRFRVEAEIVRDLTLAASGLLSRKIGGPSVFPPMPPDVAALSYANNFRWKLSPGEDRYRRGMYTFFKRTAPHPNLVAFDCPDSNTTCVERRRSNTPLQALTTLNNEVYVEAAQAMARRLLAKDNLPDDRARIDYGFRLCTARPPDSSEAAELLGLLEAARAYYADHSDEAAKAAGSQILDRVQPDEQAAWTAVTRILLNMDEFLTRE